tara:strand:+ start:1568 stop:1684 length:117 start_codon:yes stop_codon:yes gene_type:complete
MAFTLAEITELESKRITMEVVFIEVMERRLIDIHLKEK